MRIFYSAIESSGISVRFGVIIKGDATRIIKHQFGKMHEPRIAGSGSVSIMLLLESGRIDFSTMPGLHGRRIPLWKGAGGFASA